MGLPRHEGIEVGKLGRGLAANGARPDGQNRNSGGNRTTRVLPQVVDRVSIV